MNVDYVVVGQGICGTFLSWNLIKAGKTVLVVDESKPFSSSKIASGIINPVTGRRIVRTWLIEDVMPFAESAYQQLEAELGASFLRRCNVIDFHATQQMRDAFDERIKEGETYLKQHDENHWKPYMNFIYGVGEVDPTLLIDLNILLGKWRIKLSERNFLLDEHLDISQLNVHEDHITYKNITASKIIFCDGVSSYSNPYFSLLPFAPNKGEALIVDVPGLPRTNILKQGISIVPWQDDLFWVGSSFQWAFNDDKPSDGFRIKTEQSLRFWFKLPFRVVDHLAAVRPATIERRPFVGLHPKHSSIGIFNGMGTKGCSLAPYFAHELTQHLVNKKPLTPEADVQRFKRILSQLPQ